VGDVKKVVGQPLVIKSAYQWWAMYQQDASKMPSCLTKDGEVPEWTIGAVSKTVVGLASTVGSNPTLSAECI
jgi:hypothetical protein